MMEKSVTAKTWSETISDYNYIVLVVKDDKNILNVYSDNYNEIISVMKIINIFKYTYNNKI